MSLLFRSALCMSRPCDSRVMLADDDGGLALSIVKSQSIRISRLLSFSRCKEILRVATVGCKSFAHTDNSPTHKIIMRASLILLSLFAAMGSGLAVRKSLPEKVIAGYSSRCDGSVIRAVEHGVNVVLWSFFHVAPRHVDVRVSVRGRQLRSSVETPLDLECVRREIEYLNELYGDSVVHLASFGGWNARHLDESYSSQEIYDSWKRLVGDIFDGIDWDLEGNDDLTSPHNHFSIDCLEKMGHISVLAKNGKSLSSEYGHEFCSLTSISLTY